MQTAQARRSSPLTCNSLRFDDNGRSLGALRVRRRALSGHGVGRRPRHRVAVVASHRRQVEVASVTRRSQSGQVADNSRLAVDQNANASAGIAPRQYTHGRLNCSRTAARGAGSVAAVTSRRSVTVIRAPPKQASGSRGGKNARGPDDVQPLSKVHSRTEAIRITAFRRSAPNLSRSTLGTARMF